MSTLTVSLIIAVLALLIAVIALGLVLSGLSGMKSNEAQNTTTQQSLRDELQLYNSAAAGMGREIAQLKQQLLLVKEDVQLLQDYDPHLTDYELAERLTGTSELQQQEESTGQISSAEARLIERMRKKDG